MRAFSYLMGGAARASRYSDNIFEFIAKMEQESSLKWSYYSSIHCKDNFCLDRAEAFCFGKVQVKYIHTLSSRILDNPVRIIKA